MIRVAINGFGRIGRAAFKIAEKSKDIQIVAINDLADNEYLAYLLKHDSVYREYNKEIKAGEDYIQVGKKRYPVTAISELTKLPWKKYKVDVVLECTGVFVKDDAASGHIKAGAKNVIISAPAKGDDPYNTYVLGVNHKDLVNEKKKVISNASCTTNCISLPIAIMNDVFGVEKAMMTTIHAYTASQSIVDGGRGRDWRMTRAGAVNIIPTSTGAAIATTKTIPSLENKFDGIAMRVPVPTGSISDITMLLKKKTSVKEINELFKKRTKNPLYRKVLGVTEESIVSSDIVGKTYSSIIDLSLTRVIDGDLVKIVAWYDNEWGYANRLVEMAKEKVK